MLQNYKLALHLLFLSFDAFFMGVWTLIKFLFAWILFFLLIPFLNKRKMYEILMLCIKSLDK